MMKDRLTTVILAGGQSSRMGTPKHSAIWRGKPLIEWVLEAVRPLSEEIIISANDSLFSYPDVTIAPDLFPGVGPVAGIESGLREASNEKVFIVSCDTPGISTDLIRYLWSCHGDFEITLAAHNGINEPLIGIYNKTMHPIFAEAIRSGVNKPPQIIRSRRWQEVEIHPQLEFHHPHLFLNINTPEELNQ